MNYGPAGDPLALLERRDRGSISVYAQGRDYHDVVKSRLKALARFMHDRFAAEVIDPHFPGVVFNLFHPFGLPFEKLSVQDYR